MQKVAGLFSHLHQLLQTGEVDAVDAVHWRRSDVLLDVGSVHKRQVYLFCHIGGRQDHDVGMSEIKVNTKQTSVNMTKLKSDFLVKTVIKSCFVNARLRLLALCAIMRTFEIVLRLLCFLTVWSGPVEWERSWLLGWRRRAPFPPERHF